jgi:predicted ester cyclase
MSIEQNKAVVRRFVSDVLVGGNLDQIDELLAPNYINRGLGGLDRAAFKATLGGLAAAIPHRRIDIENLVAEGDAVVARFAYEMTVPTGQTVVARGLTYYALADGRIVEDDPITTPDIFQELGKLMPPPAS